MTDAAADFIETLSGIPQAGVPQASDAPYRFGQIYSTAGLANFPPTVTLSEGELAREAFITGNVWDWNPGDVVSYIYWNGAPLVVSKVPIKGTDWANEGADVWHLVGTPDEPTFQSNYTNWMVTNPASPDNHALAGFRKQSDGWVRLKGLVDVTSGTGINAPIFTLPPGYWPAFPVTFITMSGGAQARIQITTNGVVEHETGGTPSSYLSLANIVFPTAWNSAAWHYIGAENDWNTPEFDIYSPARLWMRGDGWVYMTGRLQGGPATDYPNHIMFRTPPSYADGYSAQMLAGMTIGVARLDLGGSSSPGNRRPDTVIYQNHNAALGDVILGGLHWYSARGGANTWVPLDLVNGWADFVDDYHSGAYHVDAHNVVHLRGLVNSASRTSDLMASIPSGLRPAERHVFQTVWGTTPAMGRVDVDSGGIRIVGSPTAWVSLTGISWLAET